MQKSFKLASDQYYKPTGTPARSAKFYSLFTSGFNHVLKNHLPPVHWNARKLQRETRLTLAHLRSGWCNKIGNCQARIAPDIIDLCLNCSQVAHTTKHLFNCLSKPTYRLVTDYWTYESQDFLDCRFYSTFQNVLLARLD